MWLAGGGVAMLDDDRLGYADLIAIAESTSPETVALMAREARGFIAVALSRERCLELRLREQRPVGGRSLVRHDRALPLVSVEARTGISTGISAADRARTIRMLAAGARHDMVAPGHVFPVCPDEGASTGRVAAAIAAAHLAGARPAMTICDVLADDGRMADPHQARALAARLDIPRLAISDVAHCAPAAESSLR